MTTGKYYFKKNFHLRVVLCHCGSTCFDGDWNGIVMIEKLCFLWRTDDATDVMKWQSFSNRYIQIRKKEKYLTEQKKTTNTFKQTQKKKNTYKHSRRQSLKHKSQRQLLPCCCTQPLNNFIFFDIIVIYIWKWVSFVHLLNKFLWKFIEFWVRWKNTLISWIRKYKANDCLSLDEDDEK